jgi:hypothetical protein
MRRGVQPQTLEVTLRKSWLWPDDGATLGKVVVEGLPIAAKDDIESHLSRLYSLRERMLGTEGMKRTGGDLVFYHLRMIMEMMFMSTIVDGGPSVYNLIEPEHANKLHPVGGPGEASLTLVIHSVLSLPDGRPLALISCIDNDMAKSECTSDADLESYELRFVWLLNMARERDAPPGNALLCDAGVVPLLRRLLARNAQRLVAPEWQRDMVSHGSDCSATFLTLPYTGELDSFWDITRAVDFESGRIAPSMSPTPTPRPHPATQGPNTCLACGKHAALKCSRCKKVYFCGVACQKKAWPDHKKTCKP